MYSTYELIDMEYKTEELKQIIQSAVFLFTKRDKVLLSIDTHEQSICHRIALYLENFFPNLNIDCEYNKYLERVYPVY